MKRLHPILLTLIAGVIFCVAVRPLHADSGKLSPERLDVLDQRGVFTPAFKTAIHDLVNTRDAMAMAQAEKKKLSSDLPRLKAQAAKEEAEAVALRQELAKYDHPEENDFIALQAIMADTAAKPEDQMALAQAYVWAYATSPHEAQAQQYLEQVQKKIGTQEQAEKDADAAREAARAKLIQRAHDRDLSLNEWRGFLNNMSQDDLIKYLGLPDSKTGDYWIYSGGWIVDATTKQKIGMQINFNGGRVINVDEGPHVPAP
jgi:hypothetical protein